MSELTKEETAQLVEDWCQDLEKNADKQGKVLLHYAPNGEETFCCLGRLCVVVKEKYGDRLGITSILDKTEHGDLVKYGVGGQNDGGIIHESLCNKIGFRNPNGNILYTPAEKDEEEDFNEPYEVALTEINDDWGKTFPEIAQLIREHKGNCFPFSTKSRTKRDQVMLVTCTITPESIARDCHRANNCPVAEAINEQLKPQYSCSVCSTQIGIYDIHVPTYGKQQRQYLLETDQIPSEVAQFVRHYDDALYNEPKPSAFQFQLDIPEHLLK